MSNDLKSRIEERLLALQLGPVEAAIKGGLSRDFISDLLAGRKRSVHDDKLLPLANALQCSLGYLLGIEGGPSLTALSERDRKLIAADLTAAFASQVEAVVARAIEQRLARGRPESRPLPKPSTPPTAPPKSKKSRRQK